MNEVRSYLERRRKKTNENRQGKNDAISISPFSFLRTYRELSSPRKRSIVSCVSFSVFPKKISSFLSLLFVFFFLLIFRKLRRFEGAFQ